MIRKRWWVTSRDRQFIYRLHKKDNSYGRCNQIADASIEIEKKIKELSEKEFQDEKVIIDILRKCFEDKEDIASMVEGENLEMLVEKVMELVREVYL